MIDQGKDSRSVFSLLSLTEALCSSPDLPLRGSASEDLERDVVLVESVLFVSLASLIIP